MTIQWYLHTSAGDLENGDVFKIPFCRLYSTSFGMNVISNDSLESV